MNGHKLWAMHNDPILKVRTIVTQDSFQSPISQVKLECSNKFLPYFLFYSSWCVLSLGFCFLSNVTDFNLGLCFFPICVATFLF